MIKGIPFFVGIFVRWRSNSSCIGSLGEGGLIGGKGRGRLGGRLQAKGSLEGSLEPRGRGPRA